MECNGPSMVPICRRPGRRAKSHNATTSNPIGTPKASCAVMICGHDHITMSVNHPAGPHFAWMP